LNYFHLLLEALQSIKSNLLRVFLTSAIISIGISSLVGILTSIDGIKSSISDSFSDLGSSNYTIESKRDNRGRSSGIRKKNQPPIKYRETKEFKKKYEGVGLITVSTVVTGSAELKYKSETTNPNVFVEAGDENYILVKNIILEKGRNFRKIENESGWIKS
jgi:putative ABC transport system permease protein